MKRNGLTVVALVLGLVLVACSQGMSLQEYFSQMTEISNTQKQKSDDLQAAADKEIQAAADEAAQVAIIKTFFADNLAAAQAALKQIQDVSPPDEVKDAHEDFVSALEATVAAFEEASKSIQSASTGADITAVIQEMGPKIEESSAEFDSSCAALQKAADDNEVDANLDCGQGGSTSEGSGTSPAPTMTPGP